MDPSVMEGWRDFAVATAGAAGALAGLIIVAISVNVKEIIAGKGLPARALGSIASVTVILVAAAVMLIPDQTQFWLGVQIAGFALAAFALQLNASVRLLLGDGPQSLGSKIGTAATAVGSVGLVAVGGIVLAAGSNSGLSIVAAGFIAIFIAAVTNAWVLMVEILR